jgi:phosphoribosylformimino-5-aminoimidazole carboxamide ribotide isomerase
VVDLDASRGSGDNRELVSRLVRSSQLAVQVAGGVRTPAGVEAWLAAGAAAVVMGTTAVREPDVLRTCAELHPGRVLAALDIRAGVPAVTGWTDVADISVEEVLETWQEAKLAGVVVTSVDRDGTMAGPDLELLGRVIPASRHPVTYSGGIGSLDDLAALAGAGASAAILGKALFEGRFTLAQALAAC